MRASEKLKLVAGAMLLAALLYALVAAPGLLSDPDSLVPDAPALEATR